MAENGENEPVSDDALVSALLVASRLGLPVDVQELLVHGDVSRGVPPDILRRMIVAARRFS